jgi:transposase
MRKIREILRLRFEAKLSMVKIGLACRVSSSTVSDTLVRFKVSQLPWPLAPSTGDQELQAALYRDGQAGKPPDAHVPNWVWVHRELRKGKYVTLAQLWEEYRTEHPEGYNYSWFCESYACFRSRVEPVMRQVHKMGEKCFVDYAGPKFKITDRATGEIREAELFVAVLGGSNFTYAEATWTQEIHNWLGSHVRMFEFFEGTPEILVPDNLKSGVTKANRYEPEINRSYAELAQHYGVAVLPARSRKPRDKAKVENGVLVVERWIMAVLRNRTFYSLDELNEAISFLLERLNNRAFQKIPGCRRSLFEQLEKPMLRPLPAESYQFSVWKKARVHVDYHIEVEGHRYSVPYTLTQQQVDVKLTATTIEVLHNNQRVASHRRSSVLGGWTTLKEHMPPRHAKMLEWTPQRLEEWAAKMGPSTKALVAGIMAKVPHPQQGFRASLGVLRLSKKFTESRLEAACARAVAARAFSYHSIKSILDKGIDLLPTAELQEREPIEHENIRGAAYYSQLQMELSNA